VYEARRNRILLDQIAWAGNTNHVTHKRGGKNRGKDGWRQPVSPPYTPKGTK
jgi:hypothetical protein